MPTYSIRDLENLTGVQAHTIRIWEQRYKLLSPVRTPTNIRIYAERDLRKLLCVALLNNNGLKISKIARLSDAEMAEKVLKVTEGNDANLESQIENLKLITIEMNEAKFEKIFSHMILQFGFEATIMNILTPFFKRMAYLWQTESVSAAQMNFITSLYKQKMYVAIDGLAPVENPNRKTLFLFLPQTEWMDSELLFCNYLAKKRGHQIYYLGASFPSSELTNIVANHPGSYLLSVVTLTQQDLTEYYGELLSKCDAGQQLLVTGNQTHVIKINDPRLTIFNDYAQFVKLLEE